MTGILAFALSPAGRLIGILIVAGGLYTAGFVRGKNRAESRCQTAALRAELATRTADLVIANNLAEQADRDRQAERDAVASQEDRIRDYERALAARPAGACRLTNDDVRRLRSLR